MPLLDAGYLADMTLNDVQAFYRDEDTGRVDLQLLPQRLAKFNEIGRVLQRNFGRHVASLLQQTEGRLWRDDGGGLAQQLLQPPTSDEFKTLSRIKDAQHFEIAADYYIPRFFIRNGVIELDDTLAGRLRRRRLIARNSRMELEFRASTMVAGRELAQLAGLPIPAVDEELWRSGFTRCRLCMPQSTDEDLPCPHRHLSIAYQKEHTLMELAWSLVLTTAY